MSDVPVAYYYHSDLDGVASYYNKGKDPSAKVKVLSVWNYGRREKWYVVSFKHKLTGVYYIKTDRVGLDNYMIERLRSIKWLSE